MFRTYRSVKFLFVGPMVLALLFAINLMTPHEEPWFRWAALGIGIAWVISLFRVIRALVLVGGLAALFAYLNKKREPNK